VNGFQATPGFLKVFGIESSSGKFTIQTTFQQLITSLLQVGLILASILLGFFSKWFGRRPGFFVASLLGYAGITVQIVVTTQWPIYIGRVLMGLSNGLYMNLLVLYTTEISTGSTRGPLVSLFQPFTTLGTFIGAVISNAFHTDLRRLSYQAQLITLYLVPTWIIVICFLVPESPRWLLLKGRRKQALESVTYLRGPNVSNDAAEKELQEIERSVQREKEIAKEVSWKEIFHTKELRRTLLTTSAATFHAASGINFIVGYSTFFYQQAGVSNPFVGSMISQSIGCLASFVAIYLSGVFGRRSILLSGFVVTTITMFAVAILYTAAPHSRHSGKALVAMLAIYQGAYGWSIGPLSWVVAGELPCTRLRSATFGLAMAIGFFFAWVTTFTTPYFINPTSLNWGAKLAWIWAPSNFITLVFIYFALPETKGLALEEVDNIFYHSDLTEPRRGQSHEEKSDKERIGSGSRSSIKNDILV